MKKVIALVLVIGLLLSSCASQKTIEGKTYSPYGLLNAESQKNPNIHYEVSGWALFSGIVFCETVIVPIYVFGFAIMEPVSKKDVDPNAKGVVND